MYTGLGDEDEVMDKLLVRVAVRVLDSEAVGDSVAVRVPVLDHDRLEVRVEVGVLVTDLLTLTLADSDGQTFWLLR